MRMKLPLPLLSLAATGLAALPAWSEGARMMLDCTAVTSCTQTGTCTEASRPYPITIAPQDIDVDGSGSYAITIGEASHDAKGFARTGPFHWQVGEFGLHTLTLTGEATALMIRQDTTPNGTVAPRADIDFLQCEVTF